MTYEKLKEISQEYSRQGYINILNNLKGEELLEAFKSLSDPMLKHEVSSKEMTDILMLQDDIILLLFKDVLKEKDKKETSLIDEDGGGFT